MRRTHSLTLKKTTDFRYFIHNRANDNPIDARVCAGLEELDSAQGPLITVKGYFQARAQAMIMLAVDAQIRGKVEYVVNGPSCLLLWICAPGFGALLMKKLESVLTDLGVVEIIACFDIEPFLLQLSAKRVNFYSRQQFKMVKMLYPKVEGHGPFLHVIWVKRLDGSAYNYEEYQRRFKDDDE
jgi:hypothetical protein